MVSRLVLNLRNLRANPASTGPRLGTASHGIGQWNRPDAAQKRSLFDTVVGALGEESETTDYLEDDETTREAKKLSGADGGIAMVGFNIGVRSANPVSGSPTA